MSAGRELTEPQFSESIELRYEIVRTLGQGASGVVYKVRDRESGETLALKKLLRVEPKGVARIKQEFRALAAMHHPNLIKLYDLGRSADSWFITMEYLDGTDLIADLRSSAGVPSASQVTSTLNLRGAPANQNRTPDNLDVICSAFAQLAHGLRALHRAGKLHRDLKPSNVMIAQGRVVVLDFGLVREFGETAVTVTQEDTIAGTPAYMAPEQVRNATLSDACDWYAFGVMLYEALSGDLPIDGRLNELLRRKLSEDAPSIARRVPGVPARLEELCTALLQREPQARPGFDAIASVLASFAPDFELISQASMFEELGPSRLPAQPPFIGRQAERAQLERQFEEVASGALNVVHVRGVAGSGKSALVEHFVQGLQDTSHTWNVRAPEVLVLRTRCYEREAMPFKALDGMLDALVAYFARQNDVVVSHMLPPNVEDLVRVFPVLGKVPAVQTLLVSRPRREPARERARAEQALRDLLHRVAFRCRLVLWIDDLQWADLDSVTVLKSWMESSEPPPLLLVLSYRSDELDTNSCLRLLAQVDPARRSRDSFVDLKSLEPAEMQELCAQALGGGAEEQGPLIERIVAESQGSPFLARQLLMLAQVQLDRGVADWSALTIAGLLSQLMGLLSEDQHRPGDPNALVRDDLRALNKLSARVGPAAYTRFRARVAYLSGGRDLALSLYRQHVESCEHERYFDEIERANWALGRVLGGEEGARLCADATARLRERGMLSPEREIESHFPELVGLRG